MPIYDLATPQPPENSEEEFVDPAAARMIDPQYRPRLSSSIFLRIVCIVLLVVDLLWLGWATIKLTLFLPMWLLRLGKWFPVTEGLLRSWVSIKRTLVCAVALIVGLLSPSWGIMVACTYFLMYDKEGLRSMIPRSLREQFTQDAQQL